MQDYSHLTEPQVLYHGTSRENRESILQRGLLRFPLGDTDPELGGIFFHTLIARSSEFLDVWRVDVRGVELERDRTTEHEEKDPWFVSWYKDIEPHRLTLMSQKEHV